MISSQHEIGLLQNTTPHIECSVVIIFFCITSKYLFNKKYLTTAAARLFFFRKKPFHAQKSLMNTQKRETKGTEDWTLCRTREMSDDGRLYIPQRQKTSQHTSETKGISGRDKRTKAQGSFVYE